MEDLKKSNKITEIVKLQLILKKWRRLATNSSKSSTSSKSIKFLKRTLSFTSNSIQAGSGGFSGDIVPKGYLAVCVGEELQRFIIPTEYLGHSAFGILLREAEEEFGFQQEGILRIPCDVAVFETSLKVIEKQQKDTFWFTGEDESLLGHCSSESSQLYQPQHHPQSPMCR